MIETQIFNYEDKSLRAKRTKEGFFFRLEDIFTIQGIEGLEKCVERFLKEDGWVKIDGEIYVDEPTFYLIVFRARKRSGAFKAYAKELFRTLHANKAPATINTEQIGELYTRMKEVVLGDPNIKMTPALQSFLSKAWVSFNSYFRIASYRELPAYKYAEALRYIENFIEPAPDELRKSTLVPEVKALVDATEKRTDDLLDDIEDGRIVATSSGVDFDPVRTNRFMLELRTPYLVLTNMPDPIHLVIGQIKEKELDRETISTIGQACWEALK